MIQRRNHIIREEIPVTKILAEHIIDCLGNYMNTTTKMVRKKNKKSGTRMVPLTIFFDNF